MALVKKISTGFLAGITMLGLTGLSPVSAEERYINNSNSTWNIRLADSPEKIPAGLSTFRNSASEYDENFRSDGSKSISWIIRSPEAHVDRTLEIETPHADFSVDRGMSSFIKLVNEDTEDNLFISGVAEDADGNLFEIPIIFEDENQSVTSNFRSVGENAKYPVTVTLDAGEDLFGEITYGEYKGEPKVSFSKSEYGAKNHYPWNLPMFYNEGWEEILRKDTRGHTSEKASMKHQYDCHVTGGYASWAGPTWDLEMYRPDWPGWAKKNLHNHRCNWIDTEGNTEDGDSSSS